MGTVENNNYVIRVQILDLVTGEVSIVYTVPINGWIYYVSVSPDSKQLIMSYSPPPGENPAIVQALYIMPFDGSRPPELLFMPRIKEDQYMQAEWSPDGKYIYYTHVNYQIPNDPIGFIPFLQSFEWHTRAVRKKVLLRGPIFRGCGAIQRGWSTSQLTLYRLRTSLLRRSGWKERGTSSCVWFLCARC